jgi:hypothetical protein
MAAATTRRAPDPDPATWDRLAASLRDRGALPFIDLAYQGFGDGLEADAGPTRAIAAGGECLIAASCSKNFGIYRERTGVLLAVSRDEATSRLAQANLAYLNRQNYSFPPDHGARVVSTILGDAELRADWEAELEETRLGMQALRESLAAELRRLTNSDRFDFLTRHKGMFSRLVRRPSRSSGCGPSTASTWWADSRINVAGLNARSVPVLARAMVAWASRPIPNAKAAPRAGGHAGRPPSRGSGGGDPGPRSPHIAVGALPVRGEVEALALHLLADPQAHQDVHEYVAPPAEDAAPQESSPARPGPEHELRAHGLRSRVADAAQRAGVDGRPVPSAPTMPPTPWMPNTSRLSS